MSVTNLVQLEQIQWSLVNQWHFHRNSLQISIHKQSSQAASTVIIIFTNSSQQCTLHKWYNVHDKRQPEWHKK